MANGTRGRAKQAKVITQGVTIQCPYCDSAELLVQEEATTYWDFKVHDTNGSGLVLVPENVNEVIVKKRVLWCSACDKQSTLPDITYQG